MLHHLAITGIYCTIWPSLVYTAPFGHHWYMCTIWPALVYFAPFGQHWYILHHLASTDIYCTIWPPLVHTAPFGHHWYILHHLAITNIFCTIWPPLVHTAPFGHHWYILHHLAITGIFCTIWPPLVHTAPFGQHWYILHHLASTGIYCNIWQHWYILHHLASTGIYCTIWPAPVYTAPFGQHWYILHHLASTGIYCNIWQALVYFAPFGQHWLILHHLAITGIYCTIWPALRHRGQRCIQGSALYTGFSVVYNWSHQRMKNIEDILKETGGDGRFQLMLVTFITLPRAPLLWAMLTMSYANYVPEWCCLPESGSNQSETSYCYNENNNVSMFSKSCRSSNSSCADRHFAKGTDTIVNEWDLVCERKWIVPLITSVQMAGVLIGAFIGGQLVDLIGRKKTLFISVLLSGLLNVAGGFSTSWEMFIALRFFIGSAIGGFLVVPTPYMMEFLSPSIRAFPNLIPASQLGAALMALTAWRIPDWRWVQWIGGALTVPTAIGYLGEMGCSFVPESLRWLTVQGRVEEAEDVVKYIARLNRKPVPKDCADILKGIAEKESKSTTKRYTYFHLYKGWHLFKTSIILQFLWCVVSMGSYGMSFSVASLGFNLYLNIFIMNMISIPFNLILTCIVNKIGRKYSCIIFLSLAGVCALGNLVAYLVISDKHTRDVTINVLSIFFRGTLATTWGAVIIISSEIYPTVMRGLGSGAVNTAARLGGIMAPFTLNLEDRPVVAFALMTGLLAVSVVLVTFLEETTGQAMKDVNTGQELDVEVREQKSLPNGEEMTGLGSVDGENDLPGQLSAVDPVSGSVIGNCGLREGTDNRNLQEGKDNLAFEEDVRKTRL
ncbi:hypothetical protein Btru_046571 [Bulinus truncatus]|nr:hypothetical protein Btru_046571 [Bulinus truncatus]